MKWQDKKVNLPECIHPRRIGHWSYGSESEYDADGRQAPVTWICNCGSRITLEVYNPQTGEYTDIPKELIQKFLAEHTACVAMCYNCRVVEVDYQGYPCQECEANEFYY